MTWNNIVKIGKHGDKGFPPDYIYEIEREHFHVIPQELEILNPNVVLFLTGPNYDSIIKDNFGELKYEALPNSTERQLSRVTLKMFRLHTELITQIICGVTTLTIILTP